MPAGARVEAVGVLTGWGEGVESLPADARTAALGRSVIPLDRPALDGERFRRATRECLLGVVAVEAMLRDAGIDRETIRGPGTALIFVTAAAYGASNVEWLAGRAGTLHFPYTAPSVLPGEVAIEFGLTGPYVILIGGPTATIDGLWQVGRLLAEGRCQRALVLALETFAECEALWRRIGGVRAHRPRRHGPGVPPRGRPVAAGGRGGGAGGPHAGVRAAARSGPGP
jgi:hypothetical protein